MEFAEQPGISNHEEIILNATSQATIAEQIELLAQKYAKELGKQITARITEMERMIDRITSSIKSLA